MLTVREHDVKTCSRTSTTGDTRSTLSSWPPSPTSTALRWAHTEANRPKERKNTVISNEKRNDTSFDDLFDHPCEIKCHCANHQTQSSFARILPPKHVYAVTDDMLYVLIDRYVRLNHHGTSANVPESNTVRSSKALNVELPKAECAHI